MATHIPKSAVAGEMSDARIVELLREQGPLSVAQLIRLTGVTATAVRQRLVRLQAQGDIERKAERSSRGRPVHRYSLTAKGRRRGGGNFADLAIALWQEIREIPDPQVRRGLLRRLSQRLSGMYAEEMSGESTEERMHALAGIFRDRQIPLTVTKSAELPVLEVGACPYPDLAEADRGICSMERLMFSELLGQNLRLSNCRLDGHNCCTFEATAQQDGAITVS